MICLLVDFDIFFLFKQKTAYEMRISDWSSDVCSSDLATFLGSPKMNLLDGELRAGDEGLRLRVGDDVELPLSPGEDTRDALKPLVGKRLTMGLRPEDMRINGEPGAAGQLGRAHV